MRVWDQWEESSKRQVLGSWKTCTQKISVSNVEPWEACHCLIWAIGAVDIYPALKRDTEAENHQSVEKQVLQVCSQCVFESEASVVVWEVVWHAVFLIFRAVNNAWVLMITLWHRHLHPHNTCRNYLRVNWHRNKLRTLYWWCQSRL